MDKKVVFGLYLLLFWSIALFIILVNSIPANPYSVKYNLKTSNVLPEGFGFFTRNPREPSISLYKVEGSGFKNISIRNSEGANIFGLSRYGRKRNSELITILTQLKDSSWQIGDSLALNLKCDSVTSVNLFGIKNPTFHGKYLIISQERKPWAWSSDKTLVMPYKMIIVDVDDRYIKK